MAPITEHDVLNAFMGQNLLKTYQYRKSKHERLRNVACDIFAIHGIELDLSTADKERAFLPLILHLDAICKRVATAKKTPKKHVFDFFPDKDKIFYSEAAYPNAVFIKTVQEPDLESR